jgi:hypothetical protein
LAVYALQTLSISGVGVVAQAWAEKISETQPWVPAPVRARIRMQSVVPGAKSRKLVELSPW